MGNRFHISNKIKLIQHVQRIDFTPAAWHILEQFLQLSSWLQESQQVVRIRYIFIIVWYSAEGTFKTTQEPNKILNDGTITPQISTRDYAIIMLEIRRF